MAYSPAYSRYYTQRHHAKRRGIPFLLTFEEWMKIWIDSGHWHERGCGKGKYHMARFGDKGPYAINNVKIITHEENLSEAWLGKNTQKKPARRLVLPDEVRVRIRESNINTFRSPELRNKISMANKGRKHTEEAKAKIRKAQEKRSLYRSANSRLTDEEVMQIKFMLSNGICQRRVAEKFRITPSTVCDINKGRTWNHLRNRVVWATPMVTEVFGDEKKKIIEELS